MLRYKLISPSVWRESKRPVQFSLSRAPLVSASLRNALPAPLDQGSTSSCVGHAIAEAFYVRQVKEGGIVQAARPALNNPFELASPLFAYYIARKYRGGSILTDDGANIDDAIAAVKKSGICSFSRWPTDEAKVNQEPPAEAYAAALNQQLIESTRVSLDPWTISSLLAAGFPIVCGVPIYDQAMSDEAAKTGMITMPDRKSVIQGYHAITISEIFPNSNFVSGTFHWFWNGQPWGDDGLAMMPFEFIQRYGMNGVVLKDVEEIQETVNSVI